MALKSAKVLKTSMKEPDAPERPPFKVVVHYQLHNKDPFRVFVHPYNNDTSYLLSQHATEKEALDAVHRQFAAWHLSKSYPREFFDEP